MEGLFMAAAELSGMAWLYGMKNAPGPQWPERTIAHPVCDNDEMGAFKSLSTQSQNTRLRSRLIRLAWPR